MVRHRQKRGVSPRGESSSIRSRLSASSSHTDSSPTADSSTNEDASSFIHVPISTSSNSRDFLSSLTLRPWSRRSGSGIMTRSSRNAPPEVPPPRPPDSPSRRARPLVPPGAVDDDEEDPCSICLDKRTNEAAILYCMHRYCFLCIKRWAEGSNNTCPLCKMIFSEIAFNIRSDTDYDVYKIKHRRSSVFPSRSMLFSSEYRPFARLESGLDLSVTNQGRPEPSYIQLHMARQLGMMEMRGMRGESMMSARVLLYQNDRRSVSMSRRLGAAAPTPADFCVNETLIHRLIPFLYREISVVFAIIGNLREAIITNLKHIVRTYPVNDDRFSAEVRNVFADGVVGRGATFPSRYVAIFIDELTGFIINNQEIEEFDRLNPALDSQVPRRRHNSPSRHLEMSDLWRRSREVSDLRSSYVPGPRPTLFPRFLDSSGPILTSSNSSNSPEDLSSNARPSFTVSTSSQRYNQEFPPLSSEESAPAPPRLPYAHPRQSTIESPIWSSLAHENLRERMRLMDSDDDLTLNLMVQSSQRLRDRVLRNEELRASEESPRRNNGASVFTTAGSGERVRAVHITSGPNPLYIRMPLRASYSSVAAAPSSTAPEPESFSPPPPPETAATFGLPDLQLVPINQPDLTNWPPVSPPLLSPVYDPPSPSMPLLADVEAPQSEPSTSHSPVPVTPAESLLKTEKVEGTQEEPATTSATVPERAQVPVIEISSDEEPVSVSRRRKSKDQHRPRSVRQSRDEDCVILGQSVEIKLSSEEEDVRTDSQEESGPWRPWQLEQGGPSVPQLIAFKQQRASSASDSTSEDAESSTTTGTSSTEPMQLECGSSVYIHSRQGRRDIRRQKRRLRRRRRYYEDKLRSRRPILSSAVVVPPHSSLAPKQDAGLDELSAQDVSQVLSVIEMSLPEGQTQPKSSFALPQELEQLSASSDLPETKTIDLTASRTENRTEVIDLATDTNKIEHRTAVRGRRRQELLRRVLRSTARRPDFKRKFPKWRERPQEASIVEVTSKRPKIFVEPAKRKMKAVVERKKKEEEFVDLVVDEDVKPADGEERGTTLRNLEFVYPRTMDEFYRSVRGETMIEVPSTSAALPSPAKQLPAHKVSTSAKNVTQDSRNSETSILAMGNSGNSTLEEENSLTSALEEGNSRTSALEAGNSRTSALEEGNSRTSALEEGNSETSALEAGNSRTSALEEGNSRTSALEEGNSETSALEAGSSEPLVLEAKNSKGAAQESGSSEPLVLEAKNSKGAAQESEKSETLVFEAENVGTTSQVSRNGASETLLTKRKSTELESLSQTTFETAMPQVKRSAVSGLESPQTSSEISKSPHSKKTAVSERAYSSKTSPTNLKPKLSSPSSSALDLSRTRVKRKSPPPRELNAKLEENLMEVVQKKMRLVGEGDGNGLSPMLERMDIEVAEAKSRVVEEMEVDFDCRHPEPESMEVETGDDAKARPRLLRRRWRSAEDLTGKKRVSVGTQAYCRCQALPTTKTTCTQTESADLASNGVSSTSSFLHGLCAPSSPLSTLDRTSSSSSSFVAVASGSCTPDIDSEVNKESLGRHLDVCVGSTSILD